MLFATIYEELSNYGNKEETYEQEKKKGGCIILNFALHGSKPSMKFREHHMRVALRQRLTELAEHLSYLWELWSLQKHSAWGLTTRVLLYGGEMWFVDGLLP